MNNHLLLAVGMACSLLACSSGMPEPPEPPDMVADAKKFFAPQGSLDTATGQELSDYLLKEGGIVLLAGGMLMNSFLPDWQGDAEGERDEQQGEGDALLEGEGWLKMSLPCGGNDALITFYSIFSDAGIEPYLWGNADNCAFDTGSSIIAANGDIAFFLPLESGYVAPSNWDGPQGIWMRLAGDVGYDNEGVSGSYLLMKDTTQATRILWEDGDKRFVLIISGIDSETLLQPEELLDLTMTVQTGAGDWSCNFAELQCSGPNGEELSL